MVGMMSLMMKEILRVAVVVRRTRRIQEKTMASVRWTRSPDPPCKSLEDSDGTWEVGIRTVVLILGTQSKLSATVIVKKKNSKS